jgi:hypothetical protein
LSRRQASTPFGERSELDGIPALLYEAAIKIQDLQGNEIERLRKERDEARRKICEMEAECIVHPPCSPQQYAVRMGWDCFPDKAEADENNTLFRTTDGE